ncbi:MAG: protein kinase, partial [Kofleriaceae bacterium]
MACLAHQTLVELVGDGLSERKRLEVEHHIDECPRCRKAVAELIASGSVPRVPASEELAPGGQLGTYALLSVVGAGAMGTVYAARDTTLERRVAIKLLHARHDDGQVRSRLLREAQAMARLSHPNVVSVHHAGVIDNRVYLVMELVEGTTLRAWSEQAHRTCQDIVQVFLQAGAGIAAAHETGIIHRDFKPENVLVGINQRICVTDFGLAAVVDPASQPFGHDDAPSGVRSEPTHPMTRTGAMVGTPAYMAPEQMTHQRVGPAADQFAFCVALYELLHGHRPFAGETIEELHAAIQADRVRLASNRAVPGWLSQILVRGLSASPDARFPSMNDLLAALRSGGRHRRRTIGIAAGVGFAAVCGVAIWVMSAQRDHAREASCHAVEDRFAAQFDDRRWQAIGTAFLATGVNHAVTSWD